MFDGTDFIALFRELGISATCSLDEFKLAYRRRVSQLHPDRAANKSADKARLQHLTAMYDAAIAFHRRHGRLPGSASQTGKTSHRTPPASTIAARDHAANPLVRKTLALAAIVGVLAWALLDMHAGDDEHAATEAPLAARVGVSVEAKDPAATRRLMLGMAPADVRAIEGEPLFVSETQWEYGPSWISFKCGLVDGWYSSPLRPLGSRGERPTALDALPSAKAFRGCPDPEPGH